MLSGPMITPTSVLAGSRRALTGALAGGFALSLLTIACEKVPLLAPSGSTITLTAATTVLPVNGSTSLIAQILEAGGTPPHSGTHVIFTTTLGTIEPAEAETDVNGRVTVRFVAGGANGTAIITASSGGASTGANGAVRIAVGTAAVGNVSLNANPSTISANGGTSTITAAVVDVNGNPLSSVPVRFSTSAGALSSSLVNTDEAGIAQTSLTTSVETTVTATVGVQTSGGTPPGGGTGGGTGGTGNTGNTSGQASATTTVKVNPIPTVNINPPAGTLTANSPIVFTLSIAPGTNSTAQIRDVTVNYGDGRSDNLGAVSGTNLSVQHSYGSAGTYTVRVTVTDSFGGVFSAATVIVVQPQPPLGVTINPTQTAPVGGTTTVNFTATVTPATATVASYFWSFGDGQSQTTTSNQVVHQYTSGSGVKIVSVTVTTTTGQTAQGTTSVNP
jgi:PKD repeat protein